MSMSFDNAISVIKSSVKSPCTISKVTSCGEHFLRVTFEYGYVKIVDYNDTHFQVSVYDRAEGYSADFASDVRNIPKVRIGEYLSRF